jgi:outer membrane autotransporter protein
LGVLPGTGGAGGPMGGGGGGSAVGGGTGSFLGSIPLGGAGGPTGGGGGAALGGAIFVRAGGNLTINGTSIGGGTVTGGKGGSIISLPAPGADGNALVDGIFLDGVALKMGGAQDSTISDEIGGTGSLTKAGASTLTLAAANSYTGGTVVQEGRLDVDGSVTGLLTVQTPGVLGGTGVVGTLTNQGIVTPGHAIGSLTILGDYVQTGTGLLVAETQGSASGDRLAVGGTASLAGAVRTASVGGLSGYAPRSSFTILSATGGLSGTTFDGVTSASTFLIPTLTYDANNVVLTLERSTLAAVHNRNQLAVSMALDSVETFGPGLAAAVDQLGLLDRSRAGAALEALANEEEAAATTAVLESSAQLNRLVLDRLKDRHMAEKAPATSVSGFAASGDALAAAPSLAPHREEGAWALGFAHTGRVGSSPGTRAADYSGSGAAVGGGWRIGRELELGLHAGFVNTGVRTPFAPDRTDVESTQAGIYASWQQERDYVDLLLHETWNDYTGLRSIAIGTLNAAARSRYDGQIFGAYLQAGHIFDVGRLTVSPHLVVSYRSIDENDHAESGAPGLDLNVQERSIDTVRSLLAVRVSRDYEMASGWRLTPDVDLGWSHDYSGTGRPVDSAFVGTPTIFHLVGTGADRDRLQVHAGLTTRGPSQTAFELSYNGLLSATERTEAVVGRAVWQW